VIIEDLIRLGRPLLDGGMSAGEILELVSDVNNKGAKNFFRHVFVVELPVKGSGTEPVTLPMQVWGQDSVPEGKTKKVTFLPDSKRALGVPFVLPTGGNPLHPQGRYGVPVYPCWDRHLRDFRESSDAVRHFLEGRLDRTSSITLEERVRASLADVIHQRIAELTVSDNKILGVLVLVQCGDKSAPYAYSDQPSNYDLGQSRLHPGKFIVPRFELILEAVWVAKLAEGASMGIRDGTCSICGKGERVVSSYCKAWPWALPEWNCPIPQGGNEKLMVEGIVLDAPCYRALTLGASVFGKLTKVVHRDIMRELFSPAADREGKNVAFRRKLNDLPTIRGSAYLLPIHEQALAESAVREAFISGIQGMLSFPPKTSAVLDRYMDAVTGFDVFLPEEVETADYRLTLVYFHGDVGRGDVHLRAIIQDVIPSMLRQLKEIARITSETAVALLRTISPSASDRLVAYYRTLYCSVPYVLARAYGGSHVWNQIEKSLRRQPLDALRPTMNAGRRMNSLAARYPDTRFDLNDEVIFHLTFLDFLSKYNRQVVSELRLKEGQLDFDERSLPMAMRPWKELLSAVSEASAEDLHYNSVAELAFGCGVLIRQFGRWYWNATGKDFLRHRVLTFGTDLSPDTVWKCGLAKVFDVAARYDKLRLSEDFRKRVGVTLAEFDRLQDGLHANREAFMSAFWSGHALQGYDKPGSASSETVALRSLDEAIESNGSERSNQ